MPKIFLVSCFAMPIVMLQIPPLLVDVPCGKFQFTAFEVGY